MKGERKERIVIHVDMDAFYASVEQLDHPEYRNRPVVVGADPQGGKGRGVVSACSYEARKYGIHSALPISQAYMLCPRAVFLRPRFRRYKEISKRVMEILMEFSPVVEQISIDEAFLDCTGTDRLFGSGELIARAIKDRIGKETGLVASVGVASNKSVAKIASELSKPDGLLVCSYGEEADFLARLPLEYLWGAGEKTREKLERMGFKTIGDVAVTEPDRIKAKMGMAGQKLWELANGIDKREVATSHKRKSISEEVTFQRDTSDTEWLERVIFEIADRLTRKMRRLGISGRTVTLKIRLEGFKTYTRSQTLDSAANSMKTVRDVVTGLFRSFDRGDRRIRLLGISISNLETEGQLDLFPKRSEGRTDRVFDRMKRLYGEKITRGVFLPRPPVR